MAKYQRIVTTEAGLQLLARAVAGGTVTFTAIKTGSGIYTGTEDLSAVSDLKSVQQTFGVSSATRTDTQVKLRSVLTNDNLAEGYSMTEIGLYAKNPDTGSDILYAIILAELADYLPPYETAPASITLELYLELTEEENGVTFSAEVIAGTYVPVEDFNEHTANTKIHITAAERTSWNAKLSTTGNVSDTTAAFTEASTLTALTTGEKLSVAFGKIAKAVSSLISHLADNVKHITVAERTAWNAKLDKTATAADSDKLDGLDSTAFVKLAALKAMGLLDENLATLSISDTFTFQNLCNNTTVTFFTNWTDATNFPENYGSGVMFPCLDARCRMIYYSGGTTTTKPAYVGKATQANNVWSVTWIESANIEDLAKYLPLAGGMLSGNIDMNGKKIVGCSGNYAPSLKDIFSHAGLELREKDFIGNANLDIGYAPAIGFHWAGAVGAGILMDASGNFHFVKSDGTYSTLKTGTANVIISDTAPADTTALWVS